MKVKKLAILLIVTFLTLGTVGTMTALADPTEMNSEVSLKKKSKNIWYKSTLTN